MNEQLKGFIFLKRVLAESPGREQWYGWGVKISTKVVTLRPESKTDIRLIAD